MEVRGQPHASAALLPGKESIVNVKRVSLDILERRKISFPLPRFEPQIIQFIAQSKSHCTEYAVPAPIIVVNFVKYAPCHGAFC